MGTLAGRTKNSFPILPRSEQAAEGGDNRGRRDHHQSSDRTCGPAEPCNNETSETSETNETNETNETSDNRASESKGGWMKEEGDTIALVLTDLRPTDPE